MYSDKHPLYGKKKKPKEPCPNPLFVQWLTGWRDEATEKGWKSQYTYGKALNSVRKFPLRLQSGKDCKILENIGDKICKMLDDRLAQHIAEHGSADVIPSETASDSDSSSCVISRKTTQHRPNTDVHVHVTAPSGAGANRPNHEPEARARRVSHEVSDSSEDDNAAPLPRKRPRSQSGGKAEREYVPLRRSGPYALLLTLYRNRQTANARWYMTKAELVRAAQPLADKSFSVADPGSRYTAWSAMGTLIKKNLVVKESSPAKYSITDAGCELAHRLETAQTDDSCDLQVPFRLHQGAADNQPPVPQDPGPAPLPALPTMPSDHDGSDEADSVTASLMQRLDYCYITEDGREVLQKDKAAVLIDDVSVGFLVKCNYTKLLQSGFQYQLDTTRPMGDDFVYVYLGNANTSDTVTPPPWCTAETVTTQKQSCSTKRKNKETLGNCELDRETARKKIQTREPAVTHKIVEELKVTNSVQSISKDNRVPAALSNTAVRVPAVIRAVRDPVSVESSRPCNKQHILIDSEESSMDSISSGKQNSEVGNLSKISDSRQFGGSGGILYGEKSYSVSGKVQGDSQTVLVDSQDSSQSSVASIASLSSVASSTIDNLPKPDFVLRPGQFEIVLCVDNQEFYGASKGSSKTLLPDLMKNGVHCDLRKLQVGDLLWVAREKVPFVSGQLGQPSARELVLDYIIERKRMDDLVGSCIDGRFKEQKFRLKKCGLRFPMYLIEEHGSMQHFSMPESTIKQTIVNTQVIDGFQVKRTRDSKETVAFLTVMTRYLQSLFQSKTLYAASLEDLKAASDTADINDAEQRLATFEEFNKGSVKTKALAVKEMFGKQLIQLHGMSAEKARAVIEKYPTPAHLLAAYDACSTEKSRETLLSTIKCGNSGRSLGISQSKQIQQLYCTKTPLT